MITFFSATPTVSSGSNCTTDFIIIPNPSEVNTATSGSITEPTDRFCGSSLTPKISKKFCSILFSFNILINVILIFYLCNFKL